VPTLRLSTLQPSSSALLDQSLIIASLSNVAKNQLANSLHNENKNYYYCEEREKKVKVETNLSRFYIYFSHTVSSYVDIYCLFISKLNFVFISFM
jgi:hypothetical protein